MKTLTRLTWTQLNDLTDDMLPDMIGSQWYDLVDDGADEDLIYSCQALDMVIDALTEVTHDTDCPENYSELIQQLRQVR